jgi:hypothetical protein
MEVEVCLLIQTVQSPVQYTISLVKNWEVEPVVLIYLFVNQFLALNVVTTAAVFTTEAYLRNMLIGDDDENSNPNRSHCSETSC